MSQLKRMALPIHAKVAIGWIVSAGVGIAALIVAKQRINDKRYDNMKARQRIRDSVIVD